MNHASLEIIFAAVIVLLLLGLAGYFGWRQWLMLRDLRRQTDLALEDRLYYFRQAWRRLACCALMILLASMLAGWYLSGMEQRAREMEERTRIATELDAEGQDAERRSKDMFRLYWIVLLVVLLFVLVLAALDVLAIRRFGLRHYRQIRSDRREMLEKEASILRSQRNGHG